MRRERAGRSILERVIASRIETAARSVGMATIEPSVRHAGISVAVGGFATLPEIERLWRALEDRASPSFFLSWTWIGTWLEESGSTPRIVTVRLADRIVGLGLLNPAYRRRIGLGWTCLSLHETGSREQDCIMIEDNGFLAERGLEAEVTEACLRHLVDAVPDWQELRLGGVPETVSAAAQQRGLAVHLEASRLSPFVEIGESAEDKELASLSRNTRQQIQRSLRLYGERGELSAERSPSTDEALVRFTEMAELHQRYWTGRGKPGAFADPFFDRFHRALLARGFPLGQVDVLRISAGSSLVGYLHTFFHRGDAYAYQSGFNYEANSRLKPGLVSHVLALRLCRAQSLRRYRLLAGDSRYKRSLSSGAYRLDWLSVRRPTAVFRLERLARHVLGKEP